MTVNRNDKIADIPDGFERDLAPPRSLQQALDRTRPCGEGRFAWEWSKGEGRGQPISVYCAEPLCIQTGSCTGPRFVPHLVQFDANGAPRKVKAAEAVLAARMGANMAAEQTGRSDERDDRVVAQHIAKVWKRAKAAMKGAKFG